ncbi:MAG: M56 family metallopeptidase [Bacteroides sp.]
MNSFLIYIIQANIVLAALYVVYWLVSRGNTFFELRRILLLSIWLLFPLVPLIQFSNNIALQDRAQHVESSPRLFSNVQMPSAEFIRENLRHIEVSEVDYIGYACVAGITIAILMIGRMLMQFSEILRIRRKSKAINDEDGTRIFLLPSKGASFSFFKWIFISADSIHPSLTADIVRHEKVHVQQWHSLDVCLSQFFTAICWLNPFAYLLMIETRRNLEFIADRNSLRNGADRKSYQYNLLRLTYPIYAIQIYNSFNYSNLKERIVMMNKKPSHRFRCWGYLALPMMAIAFPALGIFAEVESSLDRKPETLAIQTETRTSTTPTNSRRKRVTRKITTSKQQVIKERINDKLDKEKSAESSIVGAWRIDSGDSIISYKLLKKDGRYINMRSYNRGKSYTVTRYGTYEVMDDHVYIENLQYENGQAILPEFPILFRYNKEKGELHLKFRMWNHNFHEIWKRAKAPNV